MRVHGNLLCNSNSLLMRITQFANILSHFYIKIITLHIDFYLRILFSWNKTYVLSCQEMQIFFDFFCFIISMLSFSPKFVLNFCVIGCFFHIVINHLFFKLNINWLFWFHKWKSKDKSQYSKRWLRKVHFNVIHLWTWNGT